MNINLTFQSADYEFIVEAIKLRTTAILEAMSMQYDSQMMAANTAPNIAQQRKEINELINSEFKKELAEWELTTRQQSHSHTQAKDTQVKGSSLGLQERRHAKEGTRSSSNQIR